MTPALRKNPQFIKFFAANSLANLGNWFDFVGVLILFRYFWAADALLIALIPIMYAIPSIVLGSFAGVIADRWDQRKIIIYSDWLRAGITLCIVFAPNATVVLALLLIRNSAGTFSLPAQQSLLRVIVDEAHLLKAVTLNASIFQLVKIVGPLIGGSVVSLYSPQIAIAINACAFVLSGLIFIHVKVQGVATVQATNNVPFMEAWTEGIKIIWQHRILRASLLFGLLSTFAIQMIDVQIVSLFSVVFPNNSALTGWTIGAVGLGSLVMVMALNRLKQLTKYGLFFGLGSALIGIMAFGLGMLAEWHVIGLALIVAFIGGIGNGLTYTAINYLIQHAPPKEAIGRVTSLIDALMSILFILGPLFGGLLISRIGVVTTFQLIGLTLFIIGMLGFIFQHWIWTDGRTAGFKQETTR